ncbi:MAG: hypothetical protein AAFX94_06720 [Myxococcota bacterium]
MIEKRHIVFPLLLVASAFGCDKRENPRNPGWSNGIEEPEAEASVEPEPPVTAVAPTNPNPSSSGVDCGASARLDGDAFTVCAGTITSEAADGSNEIGVGILPTSAATELAFEGNNYSLTGVIGVSQ